MLLSRQARDLGSTGLSEQATKLLLGSRPALDASRVQLDRDPDCDWRTSNPAVAPRHLHRSHTAVTLLQAWVEIVPDAYHLPSAVAKFKPRSVQLSGVPAHIGTIGTGVAEILHGLSCQKWVIYTAHGGPVTRPAQGGPGKVLRPSTASLHHSGPRHPAGCLGLYLWLCEPQLLSPACLLG